VSLRIRWGEEEIKRFQEEGYLLFPNAVDKERCDEIRQVAKLHLKDRTPPIETEFEYIGIDKQEYRNSVRRLRQVYDRDPIFREWMQEPSIRPLLARLLGDIPVLVTAHHNSIMTKMPHSSTPTHWHRDERYWRYQDDRLLSVWLALGYEDEQNGALELIAGSHREQFSPQAFDEKDFFRDDYAPNRPWIERRVSLRLQKGDLLLFHCRLLHRAGVNRTDKTKLSFVWTVKAKGNRAIEGSRTAQFKEYPLPL